MAISNTDRRSMQSESNQTTYRREGWALATSLALHALLIWPQPPWTQGARPSSEKPGLVAHLNSRPTGAVAMDQGEPYPQNRRQHRLTMPGKQPANAAPPVRTRQSETSVLQRVERSTSSTENETMVDADLGDYRLALARTIRRLWAKMQPVAAPGFSGRAQFRLDIAASGVVSQVRCLSGSGDHPRDTAMAEMLRLASQQTHPPGGLAGRAFSIDIAVEFTGE